METSDLTKIVQKGITLISYRPRSRKELENRLNEFIDKRKLSRSLLPKGIERLTELGYINDESFAQWIVDSYKGKKAKGGSFLKKKLREEGIESSIIEAVVPTDKDEEMQAARALVDKKWLIWSQFSSEKQKRRIQDYLVRRGYSFDIVYRLVDEYVKSPYNTLT